MSRETISVPIVPMATVCFPGMLIPWNRLSGDTRKILGYLVSQDLPFAVALERPSPDNLVLSEPHTIGTIARLVEDASASPPGLAISGVTRIHLLSYRHDLHHLIGQARFLPDVDEPVPPLLIGEAKACLSEFWGIFRQGQRSWIPPKDPEAISFGIARYLPVDEEQQQELLEIRTTTARLAKEVAILRSLLERFRTRHKSS